MWTVVGVLFAAAPLIIWRSLARTRSVGLAVGGTLLAGSVLLVAVQQQWVDAPRPDVHLAFTVLMPLLVASGCALESHRKGPLPEERVPRRNGAIGFLGTQFALTLVGSMLYVLMGSEASVPPADAVPRLPPGLTALSQGSGCGSGNCYRTVTVGSAQGLSRQEVIRRLDRPHETCRPNGWLLDRRDLCVGVSETAERITLYVTLNNLID